MARILPLVTVVVTVAITPVLLNVSNLRDLLLFRDTIRAFARRQPCYAWSTLFTARENWRPEKPPFGPAGARLMKSKCEQGFGRLCSHFVFPPPRVCLCWICIERVWFGFDAPQRSRECIAMSSSPFWHSRRFCQGACLWSACCKNCSDSGSVNPAR